MICGRCNKKIEQCDNCCEKFNKEDFICCTKGINDRHYCDEDCFMQDIEIGYGNVR